jgi:hypothetical protein
MPDTILCGGRGLGGGEGEDVPHDVSGLATTSQGVFVFRRTDTVKLKIK